MTRLLYILSLLILLTAYTSCVTSPHYEKTYSIPQNQWQYNFRPSFKFEITDTTSLYNLYFLIRHTEAYPFSNVWVWVYTKRPGDSVFNKTRIEIPLAEPSGKWLGRGMGAIWEQRMPISGNEDTVMLRKKGTWEIRLEQNMRINPLPEILQVGLRIDKK
jgi:gliding motility-associated lipoprotein GldH